MTYHRVRSYVKKTGATNGTATSYLFEAPERTNGFCWGLCYSIFSFMYMFCRWLFIIFSFFSLLFSCLSFFDLRILITPFIYSNFFCISNSYKLLNKSSLSREYLLKSIYYVKIESKISFSSTHFLLVSSL